MPPFSGPANQPFVGSSSAFSVAAPEHTLERASETRVQYSSPTPPTVNNKIPVKSKLPPRVISRKVCRVIKTETASLAIRCLKEKRKGKHEYSAQRSLSNAFSTSRVSYKYSSDRREQ
jgi:hypothetical protein